MKRFIIIFFVVLFLLVQTQAFAQGPETKSEKEKPCEKGMMAQSMMGKSSEGEGSSCMMCGSMMMKKIIATSDGGIVVSFGNKLIKYDKNLKLIKEVEIKTDQAKMGCCPMHKRFHGGSMFEDVDPHTIDPYHHKPKTDELEEEKEDLHSIDPYHHKPSI